MKLFFRTALAPVFEVNFEDFFFGDQLVSLTASILDIYLVFCYLGTGLV